jgi:hypothetical protein
MADDIYAPNADDDLPRTVRQQRDAQARRSFNHQRTAGVHSDGGFSEAGFVQPPRAPGEGEPVTVTRLDLPFFHLMGFFIKAVFAAVPALIVGIVLAMGIFWVAAQAVEHYAPWLVKMRIVVSFPG